MIWLKRIGKVFAGLVALVALWLAVAALVYSPVYVGRVLAWGESDQGDYLNNFPLSSLSASQTVFSFRSSLDEERVRSVFESILGVSDFDTFLAGSATQALIVIQDDKILYEGYFNGAARDSMVTSFSVAKSFGSALIGIAIDEGFIDGVDDSVADYLPELAERDDRFELITIRDLLRMAAGLDYQELRWALFNGDDPLTTYYPNQREIALDNTPDRRSACPVLPIQQVSPTTARDDPRAHYRHVGDRVHPDPSLGSAWYGVRRSVGS